MFDKLKRLWYKISKFNYTSYFYSDGNQGDLLMNNKNRQEMQNRFSLRKLTIGLASVSLGMFFMQTSNQVKADTSSAALARANTTTVQPVQPGQPVQPVQPGQPGQPGQTSKDSSTNNGRPQLVIRAAAKQPTPATDTTTPIAPSTFVPS